MGSKRNSVSIKKKGKKPLDSIPSPLTRKFLARFESLNEIREFVGEFARSSGFKESDVYAVQLAVDEACTNIIEHAYGGECVEEIECICQVDQDTLTITLIDCGDPFNPADVPAPSLDTSLEERRTGGLGMYFMRQLMDEIHFSFIMDEGEKEGCNILRMIKRKERAA